MTDESNRQLRSVALLALRIGVGAAYFVHGAQKLFGWFGGYVPAGGGRADLMSRAGPAAFIEIFASICIMSGFMTRPVAFLVSGEMAVAYFWVHVSERGYQIWWWANAGENAMLYCFIWLFVSAWGAGEYSIDHRRATQHGG